MDFPGLHANFQWLYVQRVVSHWFKIIKIEVFKSCFWDHRYNVGGNHRLTYSFPHLKNSQVRIAFDIYDVGMPFDGLSTMMLECPLTIKYVQAFISVLLRCDVYFPRCNCHTIFFVRRTRHHFFWETPCNFSSSTSCHLLMPYRKEVTGSTYYKHGNIILLYDTQNNMKCTKLSLPLTKLSFGLWPASYAGDRRV